MYIIFILPCRTTTILTLSAGQEGELSAAWSELDKVKAELHDHKEKSKLKYEQLKSSAAEERVKAVGEVEAECNRLQTAGQKLAAQHQVDIAAQAALAEEIARMKVGTFSFCPVERQQF